MQEARLAKALTKHFYNMGAPVLLVLPCYLIPIVGALLTGYLGVLFIPGICCHLWLRTKYRKDEYWLLNYKDALSEDLYLEP